MEIILEVPDKDAARVLELLKGIKRVKVKSPKPTSDKDNTAFLAGLAEAVVDVKRHERGEIELQSWNELYAELTAEASKPTRTVDAPPARPLATPSPVDKPTQA